MHLGSMLLWKCEPAVAWKDAEEPWHGITNPVLILQITFPRWHNVGLVEARPNRIAGIRQLTLMQPDLFDFKDSASRYGVLAHSPFVCSRQQIANMFDRKEASCWSSNLTMELWHGSSPKNFVQRSFSKSRPN